MTNTIETTLLRLVAEQDIAERQRIARQLSGDFDHRISQVRRDTAAADASWYLDALDKINEVNRQQGDTNVMLSAMMKMVVDIRNGVQDGAARLGKMESQLETHDRHLIELDARDQAQYQESQAQYAESKADRAALRTATLSAIADLQARIAALEARRGDGDGS